MTTPPIDLHPGDVLLYRPKGLFGWLIFLKTWHRIGHVEVYVGLVNGQPSSVASRDGQGVNVYPLRLSELAHVLRPTRPFGLTAAMKWFNEEAKGQPYGWLDLSAFLALPFDGPGMQCACCATFFLRAGGIPVFNAERARDVAPFEFLLSDLLDAKWSDDVDDAR